MSFYRKQLSQIEECEVLVVGSGSAGSSAAIAAARSGADTLLLERYGFLGGISTGVLDTFYGFYTPGKRSLKVVGGVPDLVVNGLKRFGACLERPNTYGAGTGITYHPDYLKVVWESLVKESGARMLLHTWVQDVKVTRGRITSVIAATKMGLTRIKAKIIVDASGDADICYYAGAPFEQAGEIDPAQTLTTTFKMCNVDLARRRAVSKEQFHALMAEAAEGGCYRLPRKEGSDHITPVPNTTVTNMTRVQSFEKRKGAVVNATDPHFLTAAEVEGRQQALEYVRFLRDCVPGYEHSQLDSLSVQIGIRETRRVFGDYRLTRQDVLTAKQFDDQIGLCGAPIEDHHGGADTHWQYLPEGKCVGIPYRTLLPEGAENLLVAGRCFSATHDAQASVRSMGQCMAMGQAAGTAAALACRSGLTPRNLPFSALRDRLLSDGAILEIA